MLAKHFWQKILFSKIKTVLFDVLWQIEIIAINNLNIYFGPTLYSLLMAMVPLRWKRKETLLKPEIFWRM